MSLIARPTRQQLLNEIRDVVEDVPALATAPLYRRWHLRWGATTAEVRAALPGDGLLPDAQYRSTRAITINAPPETVWPWLVQVGCLRAGWYSDDLLDNLGHPSATTVVPSLQHIEVGQWVPMSPSPVPNDRTAFTVDSFEANSWLLWTKPDSTWAWQLTRVNDNETRLVTRIHAVYNWRHPFTAVLGVFLMEFGDFAMLRRMLRGIKSRAESLATDRPSLLGDGERIGRAPQDGARIGLRSLVGLAAIVFSALYLIADVVEVLQGDFTTFRLSLTYLGEAAIPLFVTGLYAVQRPWIGRLGLFGAVAFAYSYVFFTGTVLYALVAKTPNYHALTKVFGAWMTVHGLIMVVGGVAFGLAVVKAKVLPRWTGICLMIGVAAVAGASGLPNIARALAEAVPAAAFIGMGIASMTAPRRHDPRSQTNSS
jgi:hypothetical protein